MILFMLKVLKQDKFLKDVENVRYCTCMGKVTPFALASITKYISKQNHEFETLC